MTESNGQPFEQNAQATTNDAKEKLKYCDVVMKGGITSGVVYPRAVCELSETYQFKSIGGTSAGAIAAAATAAAELGRSKGLSSFKELETLPQWLGAPGKEKGKSNLFTLFQPEAKTRPLFDTLIAFLGENTKSKYGRVAVAALWNFKRAALLGSLPGLLLILLLLTQADHWLLAFWGGICALTLLGLGCLLGVLFQAGYSAICDIPANWYGLCTGYALPEAGRSPALTVWLASLLNRLAGLPPDTKPLTFGDLWGTEDPEAERQINLAMVTTNLSEARPYKLPFDLDNFFFDPVEFKAFFPDDVVEWMVKNPRRPPSAGDPKQNGQKLYPLPSTANFPVVVATRMSMSFPVLLSAVPLYAIDYTPKHNVCHEQAPTASAALQTPTETEELRVQKCWFSDGGIAINFPIHFFDRPIPRWPTFGINLRSLPPGHVLCKNEADNIWMPETNAEGLGVSWTYFEQKASFGKLAAFLGVILDTARNWSDEMQLRVPGYRDRVVHIKLGENEGGLNLTMPQDTITRLGDRGEFAAAELLRRFAKTSAQLPMSWDNHRWIRYRSTMTLLETMLQNIQEGLNFATEDELTYAQLISRDQNTLPNSYRWGKIAQQQFAQATTQALLDFIDQRWDKDKAQTFAEGSPSPQPELRIQPRI